MFILNNINNRNYGKDYKNIENVIFDISGKQLKNSKNKDWSSISKGDIVCVVKSSRKISTFFIVESNMNAGIPTSEDGDFFVLTGKLVAKLADEIDMTTLLNKYSVIHPYLPKNTFSNGFNVGDIGDSLDNLKVSSNSGVKKLGELS